MRNRYGYEVKIIPYEENKCILSLKDDDGIYQDKFRYGGSFIDPMGGPIIGIGDNLKNIHSSFPDKEVTGFDLTTKRIIILCK